MVDGEHAAPLVVGIGGSTSATSVTTMLLRSTLALIAERGARTVEFVGEQLATMPIYGAGAADGDVARDLVEAVRVADAVVIASPGYHGGMSGLVKNAIDHLEELRDDARPYLEGRAVGVIVGAAGWQACGTTLVSVRSTVHSLRGWPTPFGVTVNSVEQHPDENGMFDARVTGALRILADEVLQFVAWQAARR